MNLSEIFEKCIGQDHGQSIWVLNKVPRTFLESKTFKSVILLNQLLFGVAFLYPLKTENLKVFLFFQRVWKSNTGL